MSDESVATALRSSASLVVVEAPAGCGKTFQGAEYARDAAPRLADGRLLILTHTHAACDVFASRTANVRSRVEIRTIDSLISAVASAYHKCLQLPADAGSWARATPDGYDSLASKVVGLFKAAPMIPRTLAQRYPVIICDEHQDACAQRDAVVHELHLAGAKLRIFGDPMQRIYGQQKKAALLADQARWNDLKQKADAFEKLDFPHRWQKTNPDLGAWILRARAALENGQPIDLRGPLPSGLTVLVGENISPNPTSYRLEPAHSRPVRDHVSAAQSALIVARNNDAVAALSAMFGRRYPIWEGHTREAFSVLVEAIRIGSGNPGAMGEAMVQFMGAVSVGFTAASSRVLLEEIAAECAKPRRGTPGHLQELARVILDYPDHRGVARALGRLHELIGTEKAFSDVKIDHRREFQEATRMAQFESAEECFMEQARRRTFARLSPPNKSLSTIHKAKGLEFEQVVVMPCDKKRFGDSVLSRCLLYVAMSRAMKSLTFVVSRNEPTRLILY